MSILDILAANNCHSLIRKDDTQEPTQDLSGKTLGILFSASWSQQCNQFVDKLVPVYESIRNSTGTSFEIVFVSDDERPEEFQKSMESMPWLAVPFRQRIVIPAVMSHYNVQRLPGFIIISPEGKEIVSLQLGEVLVTRFGSRAFPFTKEHVDKLEAAEDTKAKDFPQELKHESHEHSLSLVKDPYTTGLFGCDICTDQGGGWAYHCKECKYDVHPACVDRQFDLRGLDEERAVKETDAEDTESATFGGLLDWLSRFLTAFRLIIVFMLAMFTRADPWKYPSSSSSSD